MQRSTTRPPATPSRPSPHRPSPSLALALAVGCGSTSAGTTSTSAASAPAPARRRVDGAAGTQAATFPVTVTGANGPVTHHRPAEAASSSLSPADDRDPLRDRRRRRRSSPSTTSRTTRRACRRRRSSRATSRTPRPSPATTRTSSCSRTTTTASSRALTKLERARPSSSPRRTTLDDELRAVHGARQGHRPRRRGRRGRAGRQGPIASGCRLGAGVRPRAEGLPRARPDLLLGDERRPSSAASTRLFGLQNIADKAKDAAGGYPQLSRGVRRQGRARPHRAGRHQVLRAERRRALAQRPGFDSDPGGEERQGRRRGRRHRLALGPADRGLRRARRQGAGWPVTPMVTSAAEERRRPAAARRPDDGASGEDARALDALRPAAHGGPAWSPRPLLVRRAAGRGRRRGRVAPRPRRLPPCSHQVGLHVGTPLDGARRPRSCCELRLPRVLLAALVGGVLAMAGAALPGCLPQPARRPLPARVGGRRRPRRDARHRLRSRTASGPLGTVPVAAFVGALARRRAGVPARHARRRAGGRRTAPPCCSPGVAVTSFLTAMQTFVQQAHTDDLRSVYSLDPRPAR